MRERQEKRWLKVDILRRDFIIIIISITLIVPLSISPKNLHRSCLCSKIKSKEENKCVQDRFEQNLELSETYFHQIEYKINILPGL